MSCRTAICMREVEKPPLLTVELLESAKRLIYGPLPINPVKKVLDTIFASFWHAVIRQKEVKDLTREEAFGICYWIGRVEIKSDVNADGKLTVSTRYPCRIEKIPNWYRVTEGRP